MDLVGKDPLFPRRLDGAIVVIVNLRTKSADIRIMRKVNRVLANEYNVVSILIESGLTLECDRGDWPAIYRIGASRDPFLPPDEIRLTG